MNFILKELVWRKKYTEITNFIELKKSNNFTELDRLMEYGKLKKYEKIIEKNSIVKIDLDKMNTESCVMNLRFYCFIFLM